MRLFLGGPTWGQYTAHAERSFGEAREKLTAAMIEAGFCDGDPYVYDIWCPTDEVRWRTQSDLQNARRAIHALTGGYVTLTKAGTIGRTIPQWDALVLLPNWRSDKLARFEKETAIMIGVPVMELDEAVKWIRGAVPRKKEAVREGGWPLFMDDDIEELKRMAEDLARPTADALPEKETSRRKFDFDTKRKKERWK